MPHKVQLLRTAEMSPGESRVVEVDAMEFAVFNVDGRFHVLSNICPHVGGPLGEGTLDGCQVVCPWHGWRFDVTNGGNTLGRKSAQCFACQVEGDWLCVEVP
jgi:nitrite reductase (NADH) small subunit